MHGWRAGGGGGGEWSIGFGCYSFFSFFFQFCFAAFKFPYTILTPLDFNQKLCVSTSRCCGVFCVCMCVQSCYNDLKDGEIIALAETAVRKADLKRKKNDEQAEVSFLFVCLLVLL